EPPPADDYYEVDMDTLAYLDAAPEPDVVVVEEPLPAAKPATGLAAEWLELFPRLGLGGLTASIAANCTLVAADDDQWHLHLDPGQSALFNATQQRRLNDALNQHLGRTLKLEVTLQKPEQETPAQAAARRRAERQRAAEASIDADPLVRQLREQFAAVVRDGTIEPLEAKA
ncbi:TPA: DNA polymerase III subunit gamma/tau C-terminal domain-containing protein, partial [Pseudomonas aeruginosa]|nr:DNA polymerase III subunit gamma/tau [Pseudomonas aeruginosa]